MPLHLFDGQARDVMATGDAILLASGTAMTLEAMLVKRPMVVGYKVNALTYWIGQRLVKIRTFALPNLLAGRKLVPELIQEGCTPEAICQELTALLAQDNSVLMDEFTRLHQQIRCDADKQAAEAVLQLLDATSDFMYPCDPSQTLVAGVDEVGRGPLVGDVVTAAVILTRLARSAD